jgi:hypothetical protein
MTSLMVEAVADGLDRQRLRAAGDDVGPSNFVVPRLHSLIPEWPEKADAKRRRDYVDPVAVFDALGWPSR